MLTPVPKEIKLNYGKVLSCMLETLQSMVCAFAIKIVEGGEQVRKVFSPYKKIIFFLERKLTLIIICVYPVYLVDCVLTKATVHSHPFLKCSLGNVTLLESDE